MEIQVALKFSQAYSVLSSPTFTAIGMLIPKFSIEINIIITTLGVFECSL